MAIDSGERYTLEELIVLYELEPRLRDVYVEGRADAGLIAWYLAQKDIEANVYAVDDRVDIPSGTSNRCGQDTNARGRAISLAIELEAALGPSVRGATVVVDADFAELIGPIPLRASPLLMTDYPAIECYALAERPMTKLLRVGLHLPSSITAAAVLAAIVPALTDIFAVRAVLFQHGIACIDDVARTCRLVPDASSADMRELVNRSLTRIAGRDRPASLDQLLDAAHIVRQWIGDRPRVARGHDVASLLVTYLRLRGPRANSEAIEVSLRMALDVEDLEYTELFQELRTRLSV